MQEITEWLRQWMVARGQSEAAALAPKDDLVARGLIDSFGMIELISAIESHYGFEFSQQDFQQPGFATLEGLSAIISRKRSTTKGKDHA